MKKTSFQNNIWATPYLPPIPVKTEGVEQNAFLLTDRQKDRWQFLPEEIAAIPSAFADNQDYCFDAVSDGSWQPVTVPSSLIMQEFDIRSNTEYYYKKTLHIPDDFRGKRIFLRFEGVYSHARVWINNRFLISHVGGFTAWDCELADIPEDGSLTLVLGVTDLEGDRKCPWNPDGLRFSDSSWASYYAHCNIGGILRDITLYALPANYIARSHVETTLSDDFRTGTAHIALEIHSSSPDVSVTAKLKNCCTQEIAAEGEFAFTDAFACETGEAADGCVISYEEAWAKANPASYENDCKYSPYSIHSAKTILTKGKAYTAVISLPVTTPLLWDAEHPNLYTVCLVLTTDGQIRQENEITFGFREITYGGKKETAPNRLYVNGSEIKLRGVCRHDISHEYGRSLTKEDIYEEILSYKRNNINHIRTSHYPATDYMLSVCDALGIYVEQENSACFKGDNSFEIYNPPEDFVNTFAEMIESARNHPSVIIWSLANESGFEKTYAFRTEYQYVKAVDATRPVIFSYPYTVHSTPLPYDIASCHYQDVTSDLGLPDIPRLHDEFAHVCCYNKERLFTDNSCREFWGESIKKGWDNIFDTDGALGCAIWGAIDDVFYLPKGTSAHYQSHSQGACTGYGEWGCVLDAYKREKPEAYLTKKAYTPILLDETKSILGKQTVLYVSNRFDHTPLSEIRLVCTDGEGRLLCDDYIKEAILPHTDGTILLDTPDAAALTLSFYHGDYLVEQHILETKQQKVPVQREPLLMIQDGQSSLFTIKHGDRLIAKGPYVTMAGLEKELTSSMSKVSYEKGVWSAQVLFEGGMTFLLTASPQDDRVTVSLTPMECTPEITSFGEVMISFQLPDAVTYVDWERRGLYSAYPEGHLSRNKGTAYPARANATNTPDVYGVKGGWSWELSMTNDYLFADSFQAPRLTNDFKTRRNQICRYAAGLQNGIALLTESEQGDVSAYANVCCDVQNQLPRLQIGKGKYYPDIAWGNYLGETLRFDETFDFKFTLSLIKDDRHE